MDQTFQAEWDSPNWCQPNGSGPGVSAQFKASQQRNLQYKSYQIIIDRPSLRLIRLIVSKYVLCLLTNKSLPFWDIPSIILFRIQSQASLEAPNRALKRRVRQRLHKKLGSMLTCEEWGGERRPLKRDNNCFILCCYVDVSIIYIYMYTYTYTFNHMILIYYVYSCIYMYLRSGNVLNRKIKSEPSFEER